MSNVQYISNFHELQELGTQLTTVIIFDHMRIGYSTHNGISIVVMRIESYEETNGDTSYYP